MDALFQRGLKIQDIPITIPNPSDRIMLFPQVKLPKEIFRIFIPSLDPNSPDFCALCPLPGPEE